MVTKTVAPIKGTGAPPPIEDRDVKPPKRGSAPRQPKSSGGTSPSQRIRAAEKKARIAQRQAKVLELDPGKAKREEVIASSRLGVPGPRQPDILTPEGVRREHREGSEGRYWGTTSPPVDTKRMVDKVVGKEGLLEAESGFDIKMRTKASSKRPTPPEDRDVAPPQRVRASSKRPDEMPLPEEMERRRRRNLGLSSPTEKKEVVLKPSRGEPVVVKSDSRAFRSKRTTFRITPKPPRLSR